MVCPTSSQRSLARHGRRRAPRVVLACALLTPFAAEAQSHAPVSPDFFAETPALDQAGAAKAAGVTRRRWGALPTGEPVYQYTLVNGRGSHITIITLGATITSLVVPDREGQMDDVVLGMSDVQGYLTKSPYFGTVAGRYANRIAKGRFSLDGKAYVLAINNGPNHLHGGLVGFDKRLWTAETLRSDSGVAVRFRLVSADGDQGYPGRMSVTVRYLFTDDDRLILDYSAATSRPTVVNLTQHSYFNLSGRQRGDILGHELLINADHFTPVDSTLIPTGSLDPVNGTPFDFRKMTAIDARIDEPREQLTYGHGYDHNFVVRRTGPGLVEAASVYEPLSGRTMEVWTTEPGMQFYTGNFLDGTIVGKEGQRYGRRAGFTLETQHFPDSPNHPDFPTTVLRPGERYRSRTIYAFGVRR